MGDEIILVTPEETQLQFSITYCRASSLTHLGKRDVTRIALSDWLEGFNS